MIAALNLGNQLLSAWNTKFIDKPRARPPADERGLSFETPLSRQA